MLLATLGHFLMNFKKLVGLENLGNPTAVKGRSQELAVDLLADLNM